MSPILHIRFLCPRWQHLPNFYTLLSPNMPWMKYHSPFSKPWTATYRFIVKVNVHFRLRILCGFDYLHDKYLASIFHLQFIFQANEAHDCAGKESRLVVLCLLSTDKQCWIYSIGHLKMGQSRHIICQKEEQWDYEHGFAVIKACSLVLFF